ncbi:MAG TPA: glycosyltransferase family protein [Flavisolibacter sp.]|nr:glycosyltransferase family protein [Flavisolibacter sp.]
MKILYAIQGTGNGHITCAREVLPILKKRAEVDILVSGTQVDVGLPYEIKYKLHGMSFIFGKKGGIDYLETYKKSRIKQLFKEIRSLPVEEYDLVFSDFEPVSAWACYLKNKACIGFSHQAAVVNKRSPRPEKSDLIGKAVLKHYAPVSHRYGFHYIPYDKDIFTPIIRSEIRERKPLNNGHYTVYLPAYSDKKIVNLLSCFPGTRWEVFSKHSKDTYEQGAVSIRPVDHEAFIDSLVSAEGVICNAGFQTPAEALYLKKKLIVIPMKGQYEQQCNAAALKMLGVPVLKNIKPKQYARVREWLEGDAHTAMDFPDETEYILDEIIDKHFNRKLEPRTPGEAIDSASSFRNLLLKKIFYQLGS